MYGLIFLDVMATRNTSNVKDKCLRCNCDPHHDYTICPNCEWCDVCDCNQCLDDEKKDGYN